MKSPAFTFVILRYHGQFGHPKVTYNEFELMNLSGRHGKSEMTPSALLG